MKDYKFDFDVNGEQYTLIFNLNVMQEIQEEYGTIDKWGNLTDGKNSEVNAKALIFGLTAMINEGIEIRNEETGENKPTLSTKQVGRLVTKMGVKNGVDVLNNAIVNATKSEEKNA